MPASAALPAGPIVTGAQVEAAATATAQEHLDTYLREMERQLGLTAESLPSIRSWTTTNELELMPEDQLPAAVCISAGTIGDPTRAHAESYTAHWSIAFGVVVSANTQEATNALAKTYIAAIRAAIIQHPTLGGFASGAQWLDESYSELNLDDHRTLAAATTAFDIQVDDSTSIYGAPTESGTAGPTVETYEVATISQPLTED